MTIEKETIDHLTDQMTEESVVRKLMKEGFSEEAALTEYHANPHYKENLRPKVLQQVEIMMAKVEALRDSVQK